MARAGLLRERPLCTLRTIAHEWTSTRDLSFRRSYFIPFVLCPDFEFIQNSSRESRQYKTIPASSDSPYCTPFPHDSHPEFRERPFSYASWKESSALGGIPISLHLCQSTRARSSPYPIFQYKSTLICLTRKFLHSAGYQSFVLRRIWAALSCTIAQWLEKQLDSYNNERSSQYIASR